MSRAGGINSAPTEIPSDGSSLLISVEFGESPGLQDLIRYQDTVRELLLTLSAFELERIEPGSVRPVREGDDWMAQMAEAEKDAIRRAIQLTTGLGEAHRLLGRRGTPRVHTETLTVSSSVTVNPWQEVYSAITAGAGSTAAALAGWQVIRHANEILEFLLRVSTFKHERQRRIEDLRQEAVQENVPVIAEVIDEIVISGSREAGQVLYAVLDLPQPLLERLEVRRISQEEAASRNQALLLIAHPGRQSDNSGGVET